MNIRTATHGDHSHLVGANIAHAKEIEDLVLDKKTVEAGVQNVLDDPGKGKYYVIDIEGQYAGGCMVTREWSDWRNAEMWWIQSVYIYPEFRGRKLFAGLYQHVLAQAKDSGAKELRLYVDQDNRRAQHVYESLGMTQSHYLMFETSL